ncbi:MAG: radical SAM protein [Ignavibacteriales bacterium]|nr:radical SAM protein [Ignavibacteriales bacterium]
MDILLTHGYFLYEDETEKRIMKPYPTLGILYISSYLKSKGFSVSIFDTTFSMKKDFFDFIEKEKPGVVGFYSNLMTKFNIVEQIRFCKQHNCKVIVGGPDVPNYTEQYINIGADVCVVGEAEETLAELLPEISKNGIHKLHSVKGIVFRDEEGKFIHTENRPLIKDLDSLPHPDRDAIDMQRYVDTWKTHHGKGSASLICARGCPYTCTWCSRSVYGETHRRRSAKNVVDEIEMLREKYQPDMLWFADDVFTINQKWFYEFHSEMKKRNIKIPFECITRADRLNEDVIQKMAELGSFRIWYGAESGSQKILDAMQRRVTVEEIQRVTKLSQKYGIEVGFFIMLGYPGEEISDIEETVDLLKETLPDLFLTTVAYPIKGTPLFKEVENIITTHDDWANVTDRGLKFSGRFSDTFYKYANRYVVNEVENFRVQKNGNGNLQKQISTFGKAKVSRMMMDLLATKI